MQVGNDSALDGTDTDVKISERKDFESEEAKSFDSVSIWKMENAAEARKYVCEKNTNA